MRADLPKSAVNRARALRRAQTEPERHLWQLLRDRRLQGVKFRRQAPVGRYIVDFLCVRHRLIIEADGAQHADSAHDRLRDEWLKAQGFTVLRFWNTDVLRDRQSVIDTIAAQCGLQW